MIVKVLSDNRDTAMGFRRAGADTVVIHEKEEVIKELAECYKNNNIAVIFVTKKLYSLAKKEIEERKLLFYAPLIVEIPDRHLKSEDEITHLSDYVRDALGVKI